MSQSWTHLIETFGKCGWVCVCVSMCGGGGVQEEHKICDDEKMLVPPEALAAIKGYKTHKFEGHKRGFFICCVMIVKT